MNAVRVVDTKRERPPMTYAARRVHPILRRLAPKIHFKTGEPHTIWNCSSMKLRLSHVALTSCYCCTSCTLPSFGIAALAHQ